MLTQQEQDAVINQVLAIRKQALRLQTMVGKGYTSTKQMKELMDRSEERLRDYLKEIG